MSLIGNNAIFFYGETMIRLRAASFAEMTSHHQAKLGTERNFAFVFATVFSLIGLFPLLHGNSPTWWALIVALIILAIGKLSPKILYYPNLYWFRFGLFLSAIIAPIFMILLYTLAIVPTGIVLKLLGKDPLKRSLDPKAKSYWVERTPETHPKTSMQRMF